MILVVFFEYVVTPGNRCQNIYLPYVEDAPTPLELLLLENGLSAFRKGFLHRVRASEML